MTEETGTGGSKQIATTLASPEMREKFVAALPKDISVDRFTRVVMTAVAMRPDLLDANRSSLYTACLRAAQDGLLPDGREGVLNVYKTKVRTPNGEQWVPMVQWMPMVEGVIKQLGKAGVTAYAASVYEKDTIRIWNDDKGQHVEHHPVVFGDRGARIGAYAVGIAKDGRAQVEAMNAEDLAKARASSKNKDGAVYQQWADRMEQKTCLHRLRKRMALIDPEIAAALSRAEDDDLIGDDDPPPAMPEGSTEPQPEAPRGRSSTLQAVVDHAKQEAETRQQQAPPAAAVDDEGEFKDF